MEVLEDVYTPQGATAGGGQVRVLAEKRKASHEAQDFYRVQGWMLCSSRLRLDRPNQTQKSRVSISFHGIFLRNTQDCPRSRGKMLIPKALRESYQELIFISDFAICYLEHVIMGRADVCSRPLGSTKWILRQQCYEVSQLKTHNGKSDASSVFSLLEKYMVLIFITQKWFSRTRINFPSSKTKKQRRRHFPFSFLLFYQLDNTHKITNTSRLRGHNVQSIFQLTICTATLCVCQYCRKERLNFWDKQQSPTEILSK